MGVMKAKRTCTRRGRGRGLAGCRVAPPQPQVPPEIQESFRLTGKLLARYTDGAVPKVLKIIPSLVNWEEALYLTEPEGWSPHAVFRATRIFISNLKPRAVTGSLAHPLP